MTKFNPTFNKLARRYLFEEVAKRTSEFKMKEPQRSLISLGIGDTTLPLPKVVTEAMMAQAAALGTSSGYTGYESAKGRLQLREKIATKWYKGAISPSEITISDGAKCDAGRLQWLFGKDVRIGIQDPSYPVYVDASVLSGFSPPILLPCTPSSSFFPTHIPPLDLIYICSPNNPTGVAATEEQLTKLVHFAKKEKMVIIYDAAYSSFIQDPTLPKSIFEIEGSRDVAIEIGSFSKMVGFTGIRLGWTVIPQDSPLSPLWERITSTFFNGVSSISQEGGLAALSDEGLEETAKRIRYYLNNAKVLKRAFKRLGYACHGGEHAPYIWIDLQGFTSWDGFDKFLQNAHIVTIPGSGFGKGGEGYLRVSAFCSFEEAKEAAQRVDRLGLALC